MITIIRVLVAIARLQLRTMHEKEAALHALAVTNGAQRDPRALAEIEALQEELDRVSLA